MASLTSVIAKDPDILGGTPVFRGTRVPFQALLDYIEGGQTLDEFRDDFPTVTREAAIDALEHAKELVLTGCDESAARRVRFSKIEEHCTAEELAEKLM